MTKQYSEEEIQKVLEYLKEKKPEHATRDQAISLLNTSESFSEMFVEIARKQRKSKKSKL